MIAEPHSAQHVMPDGEFVARLAVGRPDGPSSGVLRIWSPKGKSDVYASMRGIAGQVKISLHESGTYIAGLTTQFAAKEVEAVWTLLTKVETSCDRILIAGGANVEAEWEQGPAV